MVYGQAFANMLTAWLLEQRSKGSSFVWNNPSCWTSNHPPSCSWQENICWCLPCPAHKNKWANQSSTTPKGNSDSFFMSQNLKKCWIVLDPWKKNKEPVLGQTYRADYAHGVPGLWNVVIYICCTCWFQPYQYVLWVTECVFIAEVCTFGYPSFDSFVHSLCCFSECMYTLPQKCLEKLLSKTDLKLQEVPCLCFSDLFTKYCTGSGAIFYTHTGTA